MSMNVAADTTEGVQKARMERMYRLQRHIYDVTRAYYLLGRDDLIVSLKPPPGGSILEMGCGTGRNLVKAARWHADARLYGVDISDEMLASAGRAISNSGHRHRMHLAQGDATFFNGTLAFGTSQYDCIYFSYTLSMIPEWKQALRHAAALLAPGGSLHVVDFGSCAKLPRVFKTGLYAWLQRFHVTPRMELPSTAADIASAAGLQLQYNESHRGLAQHVTLKKTS